MERKRLSLKIYDMHTHTNNSHDSKADIITQTKAQITAGASGFAVTDHCDVQFYERDHVYERIQNSVKDALSAKEQFAGQIEILTGVEIGEGIWDEVRAEQMSCAFDYDVVLSSVHAVRYPGLTDPFSIIDFSKLSRETLEAYVDQYYTDMIEMTGKLDFDILPHITCPLRYINRKFGREIDFLTPYRGKIETVLNCIIERGIALEVNTAYAACAEEFLPSYDIVSIYKDLGGRLVTIGSDAHSPEKAARLVYEAADMLKTCGFDGYYYYKNRKPIFVSF